MELATFAFFVSASLLLIIAPGPDVVFLIAQGMTRGRKAGLVTAMGLAAGNLVHTVAAALGISAVFQASALAFTVVKTIGVLYLVFLAWKAIRHHKAFLSVSEDPQARRENLFLRGFLMNTLNPKVALFFLAFLPQFADPAAGPMWIQMILLGVLFTGLVVIVFGVIGAFAGSVNPWIQRRGSRFNEGIAWVTAGLFLSLAVRLAFMER